MGTQTIYANIDLRGGELREACIEQLSTLPNAPLAQGQLVQVGTVVYYGDTPTTWLQLGTVAAGTVLSHTIDFGSGDWNANGPNEWIVKFPTGPINTIHSAEAVNRTVSPWNNQVDAFLKIFENNTILLIANGATAPVDKYQLRLIGTA